MAQFDRITRDPSVMGGKACVRGTRAAVGMIVGQIGAGHTIDELLTEYPSLFGAWRRSSGAALRRLACRIARSHPSPRVKMAT